MKILLIGANGQLGADLQRSLQRAGHSLQPLTRANLDIRDPEKLNGAVASSAADLVINTAAFHNLEQCEKEPQEALLVNAVAIRHLALACAARGCALLHFSTDYVFGGTSAMPYVETDRPDPQSVYAFSKLAGELQVESWLERRYVVRTCGLYGEAGSRSRGGNFVDKVIRKAQAAEPLKIVNDQVLTPTSTRDLAEAVTRLIASGAYGLYHATNEGQCSWHDFAQEALRLRGLKADLQPISTVTLDSPVKRPAYSVLAKQKLYSLGLPVMPPWQDALARYLRGQS